MISLIREIKPGQTIGIIGGGQLGRMMALAAKAMGFRIAVLDPVPDCPCAQVSDEYIMGAYDDTKALAKLAKLSDVLTYEFENISAEALDWLDSESYLPQGTNILKIAQDRVAEKKAIAAAGLKVAPFRVVKSRECLRAMLEELGYPAVLKTARGGYDGKGQAVIRSEADVESAEELVLQGICVLESWVHFKKEISVIVTRNPTGETSVFPPAENIHVDNILHQSIVPARISIEAEEKAVQMAIMLAEELGVTGTLAVEMFLAENDELYINEIAPRPHNSGHYTIEACEISQFGQHIRAVANMPLASTALLKPAVMVNILGEHQGKLVDKMGALKDWHIHLYGKKEPKPQRKMGHITILRDNVDEALREIKESGIWNTDPL